jgi:hypothetical protein
VPDHAGADRIVCALRTRDVKPVMPEWKAFIESEHPLEQTFEHDVI